MRLPDFLVIGAMKAGSTSLCQAMDALNPDIFFPTVKEPHTLVFENVLTLEGKKKYASLFQKAGPNQKCGEGSTGYSKIPQHQGVAARAKKLLGEQLKLIYIVRNPVERAVSHHYHMYRSGDAPTLFKEAIEQIPMITQCSMYGMQIEPWLEAFGIEQVKILRFEDYIQAQEEIVSGLSDFLGVPIPSDEVQLTSDEINQNIGEQQLLPPPSFKGVMRTITRSQFYKRSIHPHTPRWMRELFKTTFYQKAESRPPAPGAEEVNRLIDLFEKDLENLSKLTGMSQLPWDLNQTRKKFAIKEENTTYQ